MEKYFFKSLCLLMLLPVSALFAQEQETFHHYNLKLAFELGTNVAGCQFEEPERIRQNSYSYEDDHYSSWGYVNKYSLRTSYFGVKPELFVFKNRIGIASGLRFVTTSSAIVSGREKFMWKVEENKVDLYTRYVRINDIRQQSYLLGIPLEVRYFMNRRELPFQTYFKIGASLNYRIQSKKPEVNFKNNMMEKYEKLVQTQVPEGNAFSSFAFAAIGFKIGKFREGSSTPWGNIEFHFPYILLTNQSFAFFKGGVEDFPGLGIQFSLQFPMGKNVPVGSN